MHFTPLFGLALGAWLVAACGGRTEMFSQGSDASFGAGGSPASAGASSGRAGAGQAGSSVSTAGAPGLCDNNDCAGIICPNGIEPTVSCPIDTHWVMNPGDCCPTCEPDMRIAPSCQAGKMQYETFLRTQMIDRYSHNCCADSDCVATFVQDPCEAGCRYIALRQAVAVDFSERIASESAIDCAACPPIFQSCPELPHAVCVNHVCEL